MIAITLALFSENSCFGTEKSPQMLSHNICENSPLSLKERISSILERLTSTEPSSLALPLDETLQILNEMAECQGLGHWLLMHQGLNGFWTAEAILREGGQKPSNIAYWIANHAPVFRASRERFKIFQKSLQMCLEAGDKFFVSVPCGTMEELLTLDATGKKDIQFVGIDLDPNAASWIKEAETRYKKTSVCQKTFYQTDAFRLSSHVKNADVLVSNGLNFYIKDDTEVEKLYKVFADALKPGGTFITSHLSPPSLAQPYDKAALQKQLAIVRDICEMKWQIFRPEALVKEQLSKAGFEVKEVIWDSQHMFPTYICKKR